MVIVVKAATIVVIFVAVYSFEYVLYLKPKLIGFILAAITSKTICIKEKYSTSMFVTGDGTDVDCFGDSQFVQQNATAHNFVHAVSVVSLFTMIW